MVFGSPQPEITPESNPKPASMASSLPNKSLLHQTHNFSGLKWSGNTTTAADADATTTEATENSPSQQLSNVTSQLALLDPGAEQPEPKSSTLEKKADPVPNPPLFVHGLHTQTPKSAVPAKPSKLCIRLRTREKAPVVEPELKPEPKPEPEDENDSSIASLAEAAEAEAEAEDAFQKTWNLRPRRPVVKPNGRAGALKTGAPLVQQSIPPVAGGPSKAGGKGPKGAKKKDDKDKLKISLELTREEIEEDLFIMTGVRPARRPKKRSKNLQKVFDHLSPGMWLNTVSRESYEVPEAPKGASCCLKELM